MNRQELRKRLREADRWDGETPRPPEFAELRRALSAARRSRKDARTTRALLWLSVTTAMALAALVWRGVDAPIERNGPVGTLLATPQAVGTHAPDAAARVTQLHLQAPGGTRIIWLLRRPA